MADQHQARVKDLEVAEMRERALQAENERQTVELEKSQQLAQAYQELEDAHQQLPETLVLLRPRMNPNVTLVRTPSDLPRTWCAPALLNQVFMSVLPNAAIAVGAGGRIELAAETKQDSIYVRIRDDGVGMSKEQLSRIFDLQFRSGTTRVKMGAGLSNHAGT
jgi:two-component system, NtrC family, sensor kinase